MISFPSLHSKSFRSWPVAAVLGLGVLTLFPEMRTSAEAKPAPIPAAEADADATGPALWSPPGDVLHLRLDATEPEADAVAASPPEVIRLFFSEPPQMRGTSVRLADPEGALVPTSEAEADEGDPSQVFIVPDAPLAPGAYTVHWRVMAQDGHAQNGTFGFRVAATE